MKVIRKVRRSSIQQLPPGRPVHVVPNRKCVTWQKVSESTLATGVAAVAARATTVDHALMPDAVQRQYACRSRRFGGMQGIAVRIAVGWLSRNGLRISCPSAPCVRIPEEIDRKALLKHRNLPWVDGGRIIRL
mgnify:FL=1